MKKMLNIKLSLLTALIVFSSCEKIIDQQPQTSLSAETAYATREGVEAGLLGCYNALQSTSYYGLEYWALSDLYAGVIAHTGTFPTYAQFSNRQILPDNTNVTNMWNAIYGGINRVNTIIASAETLNDPAFSKTQAIGEARFLRGLMYFDLLRAFGGSSNGFNKSGRGVPVRTSPTLSPDNAAAIPLSSEADVWKQIDADLDYAITNLKASVNGRATVNAAKALKARAALYKEDWETAETLSNEVINALKGTGTGLSSSFDALFTTQNTKPESIFELQYDINNTNSIAFYYFPTGLGGRNEIGSSATLNAQSATDLRKATNVKVLSGSNKTGKYSRINGTDNVIIIRLAELYLIRAEARAKKAAPDLTGALADLNVIRARAGLAASTAATADDILKQLYEDKYYEFAHEGHAFFDMKRTNRLSTAITGFSGANTFRAVYPTPQREIINSGGQIVQVTGY
ncbi:MAG: RagB/SusD family nutrient uptake outer membrane protein [Chitinophagaceae bacterium]